MKLNVKGILSYPHLFQPRAVNQGDDPKFSASILIRKGDPQLAYIQSVIDQEKANGWPSGFPSSGRQFLADGALKFPTDPAMANFMVISANANADSKPAVVDPNLAPVMDQSQVFAGAIVWASLNTFIYNQTVNKGVGAGLNGIMVTGEIGELGRIDGRPSVESMFDGVTVGGAPGAAPASMSAPAPAPAPAHQMTAAAQYTYDQYKASGWTDAQLIQAGFMVAPVQPSF